MISTLKQSVLRNVMNMEANLINADVHMFVRMDPATLDSPDEVRRKRMKSL